MIIKTKKMLCPYNYNYDYDYDYDDYNYDDYNYDYEYEYEYDCDIPYVEYLERINGNPKPHGLLPLRSMC
jgi:hypothetical protein